MRKKNRLLGITLALCLTGCSSEVPQSVEAPALNKPVATGESYLPVALGDVEMPVVLKATVKCREYGQTFETNQRVGEIVVNVGDYVKEGDVIAYADTSELKKELEALEKNLADEEMLYQLNAAIENDRLENTKMFGGDKLAITIAEAQENMYYRALQHEKDVKAYTDKIEKIKSDIEGNELFANHDGMVAYTYNLNRGTDVTSTTNIAVIDDFDDKYLEVDKTVEEMQVNKNKNVRFIRYNGADIPVTEMEYTGSELVLAKLYGQSPYTRFTCENIQDMKIGESANLFMINGDKKDVKIIYASSVFGDTEKYVYVKNAEGKNEQRIITIGTKFGNYVEVLSGLELGELVAYTSEDLIPVDGNVLEVNLTTFDYNNNTYLYTYSKSDVLDYRTDFEGEIVEVSNNFKRGNKVTEGDYLYTIDMGERNARLKESFYALESAKRSYAETINSYDKMVLENNKEFAANPDIIYRTYLARENEIIAFEKQIADITNGNTIARLTEEYEKISKVNDGTGLVKVYAEKTGTLDSVFIVAGDKIQKGSVTHKIYFDDGTDLRIKMKAFPKEWEKFCDEGDVAEVSERVSIYIDGKEYTGTCIGYYGTHLNTSRPYIFTKDGKSKVSFNNDAGLEGNGFYLRLDDTDELETVIASSGVYSKTYASFNYEHMEGVIEIKNSSIVKDLASSNPWVWVERDGYICKQYVLVDKGIHGDGKSKSVFILSGLKSGDKIYY